MKARTAFLFLSIVAVAVGADVPPVTCEYNGVRCWHDVAYGPRGDLPDEGEGYKGSYGGWRSALQWRSCTHRSGQFLDVYAPSRAVATNAVVALFLHGGSWSQCFDKDAVLFDLFRPLVEKGAVVGTADYILQTDITFNSAKRARKEATFAEMLRDIDAAAERLGAFARALGVTAPRLVVLGESAGGHLALLYAYDQDNPSKLGLGLKHVPRVAQAVNIVGPTAFTEKEIANSLMWKFLFFKVKNNMFSLLMKRLVGLPDNASEGDLLPLMAKWSPMDLVCAKSVPTVLAYGKMNKWISTDGLVPASQFTLLERRLKEVGVPCVSRAFVPANHAEVRGKAGKWVAEQVFETKEGK